MISHQMFLYYQEQPTVIALNLNRTHNGLYYFENQKYIEISAAKNIVNRQKIRELIANGVQHIFITRKDQNEITQQLIQQLRSNSRSLSVGNIEQNSRKQVNLITQTLGQFYQDSENNEALQLLYQASLNLTNLYKANQGLIVKNYQDIFKQNLPYYHKQPMQAALLITAFALSTKIFNEKEIENLFVVSLFKDMGLSKLSTKSLEEKKLSLIEKQIYHNHTVESVNLLQSRIPLNAPYYEIIRNHHYFHQLIDNPTSHNLKLLGIETTLVSLFDYLVYSTDPSSPETPLSMFEALQKAKDAISDQYPHEFKALILFLKNFLEQA